MDTEALRWFRFVARGYTVTEVADLHRMSQPGVSRALTRLESEVGAPLFRRSGRVLDLTPAGLAFLEQIDPALNRVDDALAAVAQLVDPETGTVSLAFQPSLGTWLVPDVIGSFRRLHPKVQYDLRAKADERESAVGPGSAVDLELSTLPIEDENRTWFPLVEEPLRLLLPADHDRARSRRASLEDVRTDPFITLRESSLLYVQLEELCERAGFAPDIVLVADDLPTLRGYVAAGLGVAILPSRWFAGAAEPMSPRVHYLELGDPGAVRTVGVSWNRSRTLLPAAELFKNHVLQRAGSGDLPQPVPIN